MTRHPCAAPGCSRDAPGRFNDFCAEHFFAIPAAYTKLLRGYRIQAANAADAEERAHLCEQAESYLRLAISKLPAAPTSSPAPAAGAGRPSSSRTAGAFLARGPGEAWADRTAERAAAAYHGTAWANLDETARRWETGRMREALRAAAETGSHG